MQLILVEQHALIKLLDIYVGTAEENKNDEDAGDKEVVEVCQHLIVHLWVD